MTGDDGGDRWFCCPLLPLHLLPLLPLHLLFPPSSTSASPSVDRSPSSSSCIIRTESHLLSPASVQRMNKGGGKGLEYVCTRDAGRAAAWTKPCQSTNEIMTQNHSALQPPRFFFMKWISLSLSLSLTHTHTRTHTHTHARTHAHTHAHTRTRTHARTHARKHTHTHIDIDESSILLLLLLVGIIRLGSQLCETRVKTFKLSLVQRSVSICTFLPVKQVN